MFKLLHKWHNPNLSAPHPSTHCSRLYAMYKYLYIMLTLRHWALPIGSAIILRFSMCDKLCVLVWLRARLSKAELFPPTFSRKQQKSLAVACEKSIHPSQKWDRLNCAEHLENHWKHCRYKLYCSSCHPYIVKACVRSAFFRCRWWCALAVRFGCPGPGMAAVAVVRWRWFMDAIQWKFGKSVDKFKLQGVKQTRSVHKNKPTRTHTHTHAARQLHKCLVNVIYNIKYYKWKRAPTPNTQQQMHRRLVESAPQPSEESGRKKKPRENTAGNIFRIWQWHS